MAFGPHLKILLSTSTYFGQMILYSMIHLLCITNKCVYIIDQQSCAILIGGSTVAMVHEQKENHSTLNCNLQFSTSLIRKL